MMKELIDKYRELHKDVPREWKVAVITKMIQDPITYVDTSWDIDLLYDNAVYYLFRKSKTKIINLYKKLGYKEPPCDMCRNIIKYWGKEVDGYMWIPELAKEFELL